MRDVRSSDCDGGQSVTFLRVADFSKIPPLSVDNKNTSPIDVLSYDLSMLRRSSVRSSKFVIVCCRFKHTLVKG